MCPPKRVQVPKNRSFTLWAIRASTSLPKVCVALLHSTLGTGSRSAQKMRNKFLCRPFFVLTLFPKVSSSLHSSAPLTVAMVLPLSSTAPGFYHLCLPV